MSFFQLIPSAYAQAAGPAGGDPYDVVRQFAPIVLIVLIFYFLLIRPQQQRTKELKRQIADIKRGDTVITAGGLIGTVSRVVSDDELLIELGENVRVRVVRSTITSVTGRGEPRTEPKAETGKPVRKGRTASESESKAQD